MKIECIHQIDASEQDADGKYEWHYEYDLFRFLEGDRRLVARSYADTSSEAHFLRFEVGARILSITRQDKDDPLLRQATEYLHSIGKTKIELLGPDGYEPLQTEA